MKDPTDWIDTMWTSVCDAYREEAITTEEAQFAAF